MRKSRIHVLVLCLTAFLSVTVSRAADTVVKKTGDEELQGTVQNVSSTEVVLKRGSTSTVNIPANEIDRIEWDGASELKIATGFERSGEIDRALDAYRKFASDSSGASKNVKADVAFLIARVSLKKAGSDPAALKAAITQMSDFCKGNTDSYRYYPALEILGRAQLSARDFAGAKATFDSLGKAPWNDFKMAAENANAQMLLAQGDVAGARSAFDRVATMNAATPNERSRRYEAMLGGASCLLTEQNYQAAQETLQKVTSEADAEDAPVQAEAYLRLGDSLRSLNRPKDAALAYLHVDILFQKERRQHAESLYKLAEIWSQLGDTRRAAEARANLESEYPQSEWTKKLGQSGTGG